MGARKASEHNGSGAPDLLGQVLAHAALHPRSLALRDGTASLTYGQLAEQAAGVAAGLSSLGVRPGDRVALHLDNSAAFVTMALGCLWLGAAFVPLAVDSPPTRLAQLVADFDPALVVVPRSARRAAPLPRRTASVAEVMGAGSTTPERSRDAERDAYLIYTSGTTGAPKGVRIPEKAMAWAVGQTVRALGLDEATRALAVSAFHFDGSYGLVFSTLVAGGTLFVPQREDILFLRRFYQLVIEEGITFTSFSPTYLRLVLSSRQLAKLAGCQLRALLLGGEECVPTDIEKLWGVAPAIKVFNRYGPTETTIAVTTYPVSRDDVASGQVPIGAPHPGVEFFIVDDHGQAIDEPNQPGELYIGGTQLMRGYWGDEGLSRQVLRDDVVAGRTLYKTGDLVFRNERGLYVYGGRLDDVVKRKGTRISLSEVARVIREAPGVTGALCALVDREGSAGVVAFVEAGPEVTPAALIEAARRQLPDAMLPDEVFVVGSFPMTSQGKIDRRRLLTDAGRTGWRGSGGPVRKMS
jgi:amino acid adenylation domain-containing protein